MSSKPQSATSPLRLLILVPNNTRATSLIPSLLSALTGTAPPQDLPTLSGYTSHPPLPLRTRYYNADVNIWIDEVPLRTSEKATSTGEDAGTDDEEYKPTLERWKEQMLSAEAGEVRAAIGGIILVLPSAAFNETSSAVKDVSRAELLEVIAAVGGLRDEVELDRGGDCAACVVLQNAVTAAAESRTEVADAVVEKLEEELLDQGVLGWDIVPWDGVTPSERALAIAEGDQSSREGRRNAYGEKRGIDRILEILEVVAWASSSDTGDSNFDFLSASDEAEAQSHDEEDILRPDKQELQREMLGLSMAVRHADGQGQPGEVDEDDLQIESLPGLLERVMAVREKGAGMPKDEREKFAKKAVAEIMGEL